MSSRIKDPTCELDILSSENKQASVAVVVIIMNHCIDGLQVKKDSIVQERNGPVWLTRQEITAGNLK